MDDEIKMERILPTSTAPRYPEWEVIQTGIGFERRTRMTEAEFNIFRTQFMQGGS